MSPQQPSETDIVGADPAVVRAALERRDPLPGTAGFAGAIDGRLVRDVLGREPLFSEAGDPSSWSHDPTALAAPERLPAGHVRTPAGDERVWSLPDPEPWAVGAQDRAVATLRAVIDETLVGVGASTGGDGPAGVESLAGEPPAGGGSLAGEPISAGDESLPGEATPAGVETEGLAIAFSGGVDSALLAARLDAPLYAVGFPDSHDLAAARSGARVLGRDVRTVELDHGTLEAAVPRVARATGRRNAMDLAIALSLFLVAERVAADGYDRLALGQGVDELFGGYDKVARAPEDPRVTADTVRGARREVVRVLPDQLERDTRTLRAAGLEPVTPLLHDRVVSAALALPGALLVSERGDRKWAFRLAARAWLPDPLAFREKSAIQYGSQVARELDRLARQAGFKRRMDDHVTRYVESLL